MGSKTGSVLDRIRSIEDRNLQLIEKDVVGKPIDAFEVVVRSNWRLEGLRWRNDVSTGFPGKPESQMA
jgi:hypothetical protein